MQPVCSGMEVLSGAAAEVTATAVATESLLAAESDSFGMLSVPSKLGIDYLLDTVDRL